MPNAEWSGMAGAEDREVWGRRPFPLERLIRDARISARRSFALSCEKQVDRADPPGRSTRRSRRAQRGANARHQREPDVWAIRCMALLSKPFIKNCSSFLGDSKSSSGILLLTIPHLGFFLGHIT